MSQSVVGDEWFFYILVQWWSSANFKWVLCWQRSENEIELLGNLYGLIKTKTFLSVAKAIYGTVNKHLMEMFYNSVFFVFVGGLWYLSASCTNGQRLPCQKHNPGKLCSVANN